MQVTYVTTGLRRSTATYNSQRAFQRSDRYITTLPPSRQAAANRTLIPAFRPLLHLNLYPLAWGSPQGNMSVPEVPDQMFAAQVTEVCVAPPYHGVSSLTWHQFHKPYEVRKIPVPRDLSPNDLLIKVAVASLCHTDFMVREGIMGTYLPCTGSHEGAGTVVATGSAVKGFKPGDRVMAGIVYHPCGHCHDCLGPETYKQYCPNCGYLGVTQSGFFAEYARVDSTFAVKLPDRVSFETAAPMACAGCTVWRGVILEELKVGQWIAIVGSGGGLGHLGIQFAKALGLHVVAIDAREEGLELSKKNGADVVIDARSGKEKVVEQVQKVTNGEGVPVTVNVSDATSAAALSCAITAMHGTMIQIAQVCIPLSQMWFVADCSKPKDIKIPFQEFVFRDIRVRGSLMCSPEQARKMLEAVAEHRITVNTNAFNGLDEIEKLIELAQSGKMNGKGIIIMDQEQIKKEKESGLDLV